MATEAVAEKAPSAELNRVFGDKSSVHTEKAVKAEPKLALEPKAEAKVEPKIEVKEDAKQKEQGQKETVKEEKQVLKAEEKKEEKPSVNWEDDTNPYKKRYQDTANWGNRVNQELLSTLKKQGEIINKKLDGTYDPAKDDVPAISPDQEKANAELSGRVAASLAAAEDRFGGEEKVKGMLGKFYEQFKEDPYAMNRVMGAKLPAMEAIKIMNEQAFMGKYGKDPDAIIENIRKETEAELRARITDEVTKQFNERIQLKEKQPSGLSEVKGATVTPGEKQAFAEKPLDKLFGR